MQEERIRSGFELFAAGHLSAELELAARLVAPMRGLQALPEDVVEALNTVKDPSGRLLLHRLCGSRVLLPYFELLLDLGADVNAGDAQGSRAGHWAALSAYTPACLTIMLPYRPDLSTPNKEGVTPLQLAAQRGSPASLRALLDRGADPFVCNAHGEDLPTVLDSLVADGRGEAHAAVFDEYKRAMRL